MHVSVDYHIILYVLLLQCYYHNKLLYDHHYVMTQWAAVMTNRSAISAPPQKNTPSKAMATCQVCSPTSASSLPIILRLSPSLDSSRLTVCSRSLVDPKRRSDRLVRQGCKVSCTPSRTADRRRRR